MQVGKSGEIDSTLRQTQIIIGALASGLFIFMVIVAGFLSARVQPLDPGAMVSMVMAAFAISMVPLRLIVPGTIISAGCRKIAQGIWVTSRPNTPTPESNEGKLLELYLTKTIVGAAFLEGAAFANLVAFMLEGQIYSIVLAVLFLLGILLAFPTHRGLTEWLDDQLRRLQEFRDMKA